MCDDALLRMIAVICERDCIIGTPHSTNGCCHDCGSSCCIAHCTTRCAVSYNILQAHCTAQCTAALYCATTAPLQYHSIQRITQAWPLKARYISCRLHSAADHLARVVAGIAPPEGALYQGSMVGTYVHQSCGTSACHNSTCPPCAVRSTTNHNATHEVHL